MNRQAKLKKLCANFFFICFFSAFSVFSLWVWGTTRAGNPRPSKALPRLLTQAPSADRLLRTQEQLEAAPTVTVVVETLPEHLDPIQAQKIEDRLAVRALYRGLFRWGPHQTLLYDLCTGFEEKNPSLWLFRLSPQAYWSDGSAITPLEVVESWRRLADPASHSPHAHKLIEMGVLHASEIGKGLKPAQTLGIEVVPSTREIRLRLTKKISRTKLFHLLSQEYFFPVKMRSSKEKGGPKYQANFSVFSGPCQRSLQPDEAGIPMRPNPYYYFPLLSGSASGYTPLKTFQQAPFSLHFTQALPQGEQTPHLLIAPRASIQGEGKERPLQAFQAVQSTLIFIELLPSKQLGEATGKQLIQGLKRALIPLSANFRWRKRWITPVHSDALLFPIANLYQPLASREFAWPEMRRKAEACAQLNHLLSAHPTLQKVTLLMEGASAEEREALKTLFQSSLASRVPLEIEVMEATQEDSSAEGAPLLKLSSFEAESWHLPEWLHRWRNYCANNPKSHGFSIEGFRLLDNASSWWKRYETAGSDYRRLENFKTAEALLLSQGCFFPIGQAYRPYQHSPTFTVESYDPEGLLDWSSLCFQPALSKPPHPPEDRAP